MKKKGTYNTDKECTHISLDEIWGFLNHQMDLEQKARFTLHLWHCKECLILTQQQQRIKAEIAVSHNQIAASVSNIHEPVENPVTLYLKELVDRIDNWTRSGIIKYREGIEKVEEVLGDLKPLLHEKWNQYYFQISETMDLNKNYWHEQLLINNIPTTNANIGVYDPSDIKSSEIITNLNENEFEITVERQDKRKRIVIKSLKHKALLNNNIVLIRCEKDTLKEIENIDFSPFIIDPVEFVKEGSYNLISKIDLPEDEYLYILRIKELRKQ